MPIADADGLEAAPWGSGPGVFFDLHEASPARAEATRRAFCEGLGGLLRAEGVEPEPARALAGEVCERMSAADRHYHTPVHVLLILGQARRLGLELRSEDALALWLHDNVFDPRAKPGISEEASARWVQERLPEVGVSERVARRAAESIRWTARFLEPEVPAEHALVLDLDLAGLARPPACFDKQSIAVRDEQPHLSDEEYQRWNLSLFETLLGRDRIYRSPECAPLEAPARVNLERARERMHGSG